jgi:O-antigen ligase
MNGATTVYPLEFQAGAAARNVDRLTDSLMGGVILLMVVFGPWVFGTTQAWAVRVMTAAGLSLWILLGVQWLARWAPHQRTEDSRRSPAAGDREGGAERRMHRRGRRTEGRGRRRTDVAALGLAVLTGLVLLYCLVSALNARSTYRPEAWNFAYHPAIDWLPHSYDSESSWRAFWTYSGLAGFFWAVRGWILSGQRAGGEEGGLGIGTSEPGEHRHEGQEGRRNDEGWGRETGALSRGELSTGAQTAGPQAHRTAGRKRNALLPRRVQVLLWVVCLNGALLGAEGILQRMDGTNKLLWLVEPRINRAAAAQFGPYAYRSNAAQYLNLIWPMALGLWWTYQRARGGSGGPGAGSGSKRHHLLLSCAMVMAVCPALSSSRGGALVMVANAFLAGVVLAMAQWRSHWGMKLSVFGFLAGTVSLAMLLGWRELGPRLEMYKEGLAGRESLAVVGWRMAEDNPLFGTGPGTFANLYQVFRRASSDPWPAQLHNDWLETLVTFGWVGTSLIVLALVLTGLRWFRAGGIYGDKYCVMLVWIALTGCMVHAVFDFPFQIHSVLTMFLLLCSVLSCLSREPR